MLGLEKKKKQQLGYTSRTPARRVLSPFARQVIVGLSVLLFIALCIYFVRYLTHLERFQISTIEVVGGTTIDHELIRDSAAKALIGEYLRIVPKRFFAFYPKEAVATSIANIQRVKHVHVEYVGDRTLTIAFEEHIPYALWCSDAHIARCFLMDTQGYAFADAPALEGSAFIRYFTTVQEPELRTSGFDAAFISASRAFADLLLSELDLYVTQVRQLDMYDVEYTLASGGIIKVSQKMDTHTVFQNLKTILASEEFAHIAPGDFQYIDLRFGDKVFVREAATVTSTTSSSTQGAQ
jgi:hypothetical protein